MLSRWFHPAFTLGILLATAGPLRAAEPPEVVGKPKNLFLDQGPFVFVSVNSNKALDVSGISKDDGAQVWQYTQNGQLNQQWTLRSVGTNLFNLVSVNSGKVLDIVNNGTANGSLVQQWDAWGGVNQQWTFQQQADGSYAIVAQNSGKCLDVLGFSQADEATVEIWDCTGGPNQHWFASAPPAVTTPAPTPTAAPAPTPTPTPAPTTGGTSLPIHVVGNQLLNSANQVVQLRGANIASLVWTDAGELAETVNPPTCYQGQTLIDTITELFDNWHANHIRLALNPDRWWNVTGQGAEYRALVDQIVDLVESKGGYVNLDMHVSDTGTWTVNTTQHGLPDVNTQTVLADVAARYANRPGVLFGTYNEPQIIPWDVWLNGGWVTDITGASFQGIGMQAMVDTVRAAGAKNVVIVDGISWASDLTGVMNGYAVNDDQIMYDAHVYPGVGTVQDWWNKVGLVSQRYPLYVGEFGAFEPGNSLNAPWSDAATYVTAVTQWISQYKFNYAAWTFGPDAPPTLLQDWCYTPTSYYGAIVKPWMAQQ